MNSVHDPATPALAIQRLDDGTVLIREEILHGLINIVAMNCEAYAGEKSGDTLGAVMATCAGYAVGSLVIDRDRIMPMREKLIAAIDAGMADGLEDNKRLPKLNG